MLTDKPVESNSEVQEDVKRKKSRTPININNVIEYITKKKYPDKADKLTKRSIRRSARQNFKIEAGSLLYKSLKRSKPGTINITGTDGVGQTGTDGVGQTGTDGVGQTDMNGVCQTGTDEVGTGTDVVGTGTHQARTILQIDDNWRKVIMTPTEKRDVLHNAHSSSPGGHCGRDKTINKIQKFFWWPGLVRDVKEYIRACPICQTTLTKARKAREPMASPISAELPILWNMVGIDLLEMPETTARGNKYICTVTCNYTKWAEAKALPSDDITLVSVFLEEIFLRYGFPNVMLSGQGCEYCNKLANGVSKLLKSHHFKTTVYHPQTASLSGRFNVILDKILHRLHRRDWDNHLDSCLFEYRTATHEDTKFSPFYLMYGREPLIPDIENDESMMSDYEDDESMHSEDGNNELLLSDGRDEAMRPKRTKAERMPSLPKIVKIESTCILPKDVNDEFSVEIDRFGSDGDPRPHHELAITDYLHLAPTQSATDTEDAQSLSNRIYRGYTERGELM